MFKLISNAIYRPSDGDKVKTATESSEITDLKQTMLCNTTNTHAKTHTHTRSLSKGTLFGGNTIHL